MLHCPTSLQKCGTEISDRRTRTQSPNSTQQWLKAPVVLPGDTHLDYCVTDCEYNYQEQVYRDCCCWNGHNQRSEQQTEASDDPKADGEAAAEDDHQSLSGDQGTCNSGPFSGAQRLCDSIQNEQRMSSRSR